MGACSPLVQGSDKLRHVSVIISAFRMNCRRDPFVFSPAVVFVGKFKVPNVIVCLFDVYFSAHNIDFTGPSQRVTGGKQ